jgi:hypothetical protein
MKIEAIFGGALALFVIAVAVWALVNSQFGQGPGQGPVGPGPGGPVVAGGGDLCSCFDEGYRLAGTDVGVMSSQYRTGFELCRAQLGPEGGQYWTAGWNARMSAKPWQANCRSWENNRG